MRFLAFFLVLACEGVDEEGQPLAWPELPPAVCTPGAAAMVGAADYASVQAAIDDAHGTPVTLCQGTWPANLRHTSTDPLFIEGAGSYIFDYVLDGGGLGPVLEGDPAIQDQRLFMRNLVVRNGVGRLGAPGGLGAAGGVTLDAVDGELYLDSVSFESNSTPASGGGAASRARRVTVINTIFLDNHADVCGGAVFFNPSRGQIDMMGIDMALNSAGQSCGAIGITSGSVFGPQVGRTDIRLYSGEIALNEADVAGAVWIDLLNFGTVELRGLDIVQNTATTAVGAVRLQGFGGVDRDFRLINVSFTENQAPMVGALALVGLVPGDPQRFRMRGGRVERTDSAGTGAIGLDGRAWLDLQGVDFGRNSRDNDLDIRGCNGSFDSWTSGVVDPRAGDPCP